MFNRNLKERNEASTPIGTLHEAILKDELVTVKNVLSTHKNLINKVYQTDLPALIIGDDAPLICYTPFYKAIAKKNIQIINCLLQTTDLDLNVRSDKDKFEQGIKLCINDNYLHLAARFGTQEIFDAIFCKNPWLLLSPNSEDKTPDELGTSIRTNIIYLATLVKPEMNNLAEIRQVIYTKVNSAKAAIANRSLLHWAVILNDLEKVQSLLEEANININQTDNLGCNALDYATEHSAIYEALIKKKAIKGSKEEKKSPKNSEPSPNENISPPVTKSANKSPVLFKNKRNTNWQEFENKKENFKDHGTLNLLKRDEQGRTILHWAIICGLDAGQTKKYLNENINFADQFGKTALHYAAELGNLENVKLLVENNAYILKYDYKRAENYKPDDYLPPLLYATKEGHFEVVEYLLEQNPDCALETSRFGGSALLFAIHSKRFDLVEKFIPFHPNKKFKPYLTKNIGTTQVGDTYLIAAVREGNMDIVTKLIKSGYDIHDINNDNMTPFLVAAEQGFDEIGKLLLDKKNKEEIIDALQLAVINGHVNFVQFLLAIPIDQSTFLNLYDTLIQQAAQNGRTTVLKLLWEKKNVIDSEQNTLPSLNFSFLACSAAERGHEDTVQFLYEKAKGEKINDSAVLFSAIKSKKIEMVSCVLNRCQNNSSNKELEALLSEPLKKHQAKSLGTFKEGDTPLLAAIRQGNVEIINLLLNFMLNDSESLKKTNNKTPLELALSFPDTNKALAMANLLIEKSVNIDDKDKEKLFKLYDPNEEKNFRQSLINAVGEGHFAAVRLFYDKCPINSTTLKYLLFLAIDRQNLKILGYLLSQQDFDKNFLKKLLSKKFGNPWGKLPFQKQDTLLMAAIRKGNLAIVKYLIEKGADVNQVGEHHITPLMLACQLTNKEIIDKLIDSGASLTAKSKDGMTASHFLALNKTIVNSSEITSLIPKLGNNLDNASSMLSFNKNFKLNPFHTAILANNVPMVDAFLAANKEFLNSRCGANKDPLMLAIKTNHTDMAKLLIENGINLTNQDDNGRNALMYAAKQGNLKIVELLLKKNPYLLHKNGEKFREYDRDQLGNTALHYAAKHGHLDICKMLVAHNDSELSVALLTHENKKGDTASEIAKGKAKAPLELLEYILARGKYQSKYYFFSHIKHLFCNSKASHSRDEKLEAGAYLARKQGFNPVLIRKLLNEAEPNKNLPLLTSAPVKLAHLQGRLGEINHELENANKPRKNSVFSFL